MLKVNAVEHSVTGLQHDAEQFLHWLHSQNYAFQTISPSSHTAYLSRRGQVQAHDLRDIFGWSLPFEADLLPSSIFELLRAHALIEQVAAQNDHQSHHHSTSDAATHNAATHDAANHDPATNIVIQVPKLWHSHIRVSSLNQCLLIHSAYPTTQDNAVFFGPDTYRFVHALTQYLTAKQPHIQRAIEICSGAAPAAITIARYAPHAEVIAADLNALALQYSVINAYRNQASNVLSVHSNLYQNITGEFDFITANPPYLVDAKQRLYRHGGDLMGAALSLKIVQESLDHLALHGTLLLYTGVVITQGKDLFYEALQLHMASQQHRFSMQYTEIDPDIFADELDTGAYADAERIAAVVLVLTRLV